MHGRLTRSKLPPASDAQDVVRNFEERVVGPAQGAPGFRGVVLMLNREAGEAITIAYWEDKAALDASAERMKQIRESAHEASAVALTIVSVESGEVLSMERVGDP